MGLYNGPANFYSKCKAIGLPFYLKMAGINLPAKFWSKSKAIGLQKLNLKNSGSKFWSKSKAIAFQKFHAKFHPGSNFGQKVRL